MILFMLYVIIIDFCILLAAVVVSLQVYQEYVFQQKLCDLYRSE